MNFSPQESSLRSRYFLASCDGKTTPDLDALDSVALSSPLQFLPEKRVRRRSAGSFVERRLVNEPSPDRKRRKKVTSAQKQGEVVIVLISSRQETGARHERSAWALLCYFIVSFTSDYKMLF